MVRETRHLWVGNLPENIREERIREHFKRYGRVQSVKLLPGSNGSICAAVAFMDIKSASKAHNCEHTLDEHALSTEYYEPGPYTSSQQRFPIGITDDHSTFERTSHFYDRGASTPGAPLSATGTRSDVDGYLRRSTVYHPSSDPLRGRPRDRPYRNGPPYPPGTESGLPVGCRSSCSNSRRNWIYETGAVRYINSSEEHGVNKSKKVRSGSESRSGSQSSRSRSPTRSTTGSPRSSDSSTRSDSPRSTRVSVQSTVAPPVQQTASTTLAVYSEDRRPLAICVRNLPTRSSDTSLKDGLFHEYKKHGKVTWVKVVGAANERYALVCFKKPEDVEKAIEVSQDKLFFGCKIDVAPYHGYDVEDNEARPYDTELDEYHPKATRTLFIGNLEKDVTAGDIRQHFDQFGEIIEIDIKKQPGVTSSYAFCQYADIGSVVQAMRTLDGELLGESRLKLGFGKSMASSCVWIAGVAEQVSDKYLDLQFRKFGPVSHVVVDRERGQALIFYEQVSAAAAAVKEMRGVPLRGNRIQIDFASRECQEAFYERIDVQGRDTNWSSFESSRSERDMLCSRYESSRFRYDPSRVRSSSYSRSSGGRTPRRHEVYDSPRYKSYEELSPSSDHDEYASGEAPDLRHLHKERNHLQHLLDQLDRPLRSVTAADQGLVVTTHNHRRRLSSHQRSSGEGPAPLCKRRKTGSTSEDERKKHHHHHSGDERRPGTPLFDEKPDNVQPQEPRRMPRERPEEPLSLPLPQFAAHCFSNAKSAACTPTSTQSTTTQAPPASPVRPPSPSSTTSSSEVSPQSPTLEERIRSLDEKYEKWTGRTLQPPVKPKHRLLDVDVRELQPSDIVKSVLAKPSVFDEDSKRLENFGEKYEPRDFSSYPRSVGLDMQRFVPGDPRNPTYISNLSVKVSPLNSPSGVLLSPCPAAKGLQYPFPSHPPVQPTTSVATTTAGSSPPSASVVRSISKSVEFSVQKTESWLSKNSDLSMPKDNLISGGFAQRFSIHSKTSEAAAHNSNASRHNVMKLTDLVTQKIDIPAQKSLDPRLEKGNYPATVTTSVLSQRMTVKSSDGAEAVKNDTSTQKFGILGNSSNNNNNNNSNSNSNSNSINTTNTSNKSVVNNGNSVSNYISNNNSASNSNYNNNNNNSSSSSSNISSSHNNNVNSDINRNSGNLGGINNYNKNDGIKKENSVNSEVLKTGKEDSKVSKCDVDSVRMNRVNSVGKIEEAVAKVGDGTFAHGTNKGVKQEPVPPQQKTNIENSSDKNIPVNPSDSSGASSAEHKISNKKSKADSEICCTFSSDKTSLESKESIGGKIIQDCESTKKIDSSLLKTNVSHNKTPNVILTELEDTLRNRSIPDLVKSDTTKSNVNGSSVKTGEITSKISENSATLINKNDKHLSNKSGSVYKDELSIYHIRDKETSSDNTEKGKSSVKEKEKNTSNKEERIGREVEKDRHKDKAATEKERERDKGIVREKQKDREVPENVDKERKKDREVETERKKDRESMEVIEREKRRETDAEKERRKDSSDVLDRRKDSSEKKSQDLDRFKKKEEEKEKKKEKEMLEKRKDSHSSEKHKKSSSDDKKKETETDGKKKEKSSSSSSSGGGGGGGGGGVGGGSSSQPAVVGSKRRISSQDCQESGLEDSKRPKTEHKRRDSKESKTLFNSVLHNSSSSNKVVKVDSKSHESKSSDSKHKSEVSSTTKSIDSRQQEYKRKEESERKKYTGDTVDKKKDMKKIQIKLEDVLKNSNDHNGKSNRESDKFSSLETIEEKKHSHTKKESKEKKKSTKPEFGSTESLEEKKVQRKEKRNSSDKKREEESSEGKRSKEKTKNEPKKENGHESETDSDSEPKKHSIFDVVLDEPAYISMYDKVKARSCKNMQKQEEEKRQVKLKEKFSQLKQSRAKREEKKRSTSWDEDSDSDASQIRRIPRRSFSRLSSEDEGVNKREKKASESWDTDTRRSKKSYDTSEDEGIKVKSTARTSEIYSDESDAGFVENESKLHRKYRSKSKNINVFESSEEETVKKPVTVAKETYETSTSKPEKISIENKNKVRLSLDSCTDRFCYESKSKKRTLTESMSEGEPSYILTAKSADKSERKKSKKKDKRQKSVDGDSKCVEMEFAFASKSEGESKAQKIEKRDRRKSQPGSENQDESLRQKKSKSKGSSSHYESSTKSEDNKYDDIFADMSDDSNDNHIQTKLGSSNSKGTSKWHVAQIYGTDSDSNVDASEHVSLGKVRKSKDKRKRDKKSREPSDELLEAGRTLEKMLTSSPTRRDSEDSKYRDSIDDFGEIKMKTTKEKKKRKKSKEEKSSRHYHHHHHSNFSGKSEASGAQPEHKTETTSSVTVAHMSPSLPSLLDIPNSPSSIKQESPSPPMVTSNTKVEKVLPTFSYEMDEKMHESAVQSIALLDVPKIEPKTEEKETIETLVDKKEENKERTVISQEETEDAVAALLGETFTYSSCFEGDSPMEAEPEQHDEEEMRQAVQSLNEGKPDTPQSESGLQIDTDAEEQDEQFNGLRFDSLPRTPDVDLSAPPKTPDIQQSYVVEAKAVAFPRKDTTRNSREEMEVPIVQPPFSDPLITYQTEIKNKDIDLKPPILKPASPKLFKDEPPTIEPISSISGTERIYVDNRLLLHPPPLVPVAKTVSIATTKTSPSLSIVRPVISLSSSSTPPTLVLTQIRTTAPLNVSHSTSQIPRKTFTISSTTPSILTTRSSLPPPILSPVTPTLTSPVKLSTAETSSSRFPTSATVVSSQHLPTHLIPQKIILHQVSRAVPTRLIPAQGSVVKVVDSSLNIQKPSEMPMLTVPESVNTTSHQVPTSTVATPFTSAGLTSCSTSFSSVTGYELTRPEVTPQPASVISVLPRTAQAAVPAPKYTRGATSSGAIATVTTPPAPTTATTSLTASVISVSSSDIDVKTSLPNSQNVIQTNVVSPPKIVSQPPQQSTEVTPAPEAKAKEIEKPVAACAPRQMSVIELSATDGSTKGLDVQAAEIETREPEKEKVEEEKRGNFKKDIIEQFGEELENKQKDYSEKEINESHIIHHTSEQQHQEPAFKKISHEVPEHNESVIKKVDSVSSMKSEESVNESADACDKSDTSSVNQDDSVKAMSSEEENKQIHTMSTRKGRKKNNRGGMAGRKGKQGSGNKAEVASAKRGGKAQKAGKMANDLGKKQSKDVYEFHDESDEDGSGEKERPRLILTIKSPNSNKEQPAAPAKPCTPSNKSPTCGSKSPKGAKSPEQKPIEKEIGTSTPVNTRKSRRLQEKDGYRNTVDDVIEDVVRNNGNKKATSPRRSLRQVTKGSPVLPVKKMATRTAKKMTGCTSTDDETKDEGGVVKAPDSSFSEEKEMASGIKTLHSAEEEQEANAETSDEEPTTLIDPVTGMLMVMRAKEEGKYVPVANVPPIAPPTPPPPPAPAKAEVSPIVTEGLASHWLAHETLKQQAVIKIQTYGDCNKVNPVYMNRPPTPPTTPQGRMQEPVTRLPVEIIKKMAPEHDPEHAKPEQDVKILLQPMELSKQKICHLDQGKIYSDINRMEYGDPNRAAMSDGGKIVRQMPKTQNPPIVSKGLCSKAAAILTSPNKQLYQNPKHMKMSPQNQILTGAVASSPPRVVKTTPPAHELHPMTGAVASPPPRAPHLTSQQPIVTGASSSRALVDPPKGPGASPRGMTRPAYEATLQTPTQNLHSPPPAHQQGEGINMGHLGHPPFVHPQIMYQQYLRAQEMLPSPYQLTTSLQGKLEERERERGAGDMGRSPPLELRNQRATDSPTVYMGRQQYTRYYDEPPPAHLHTGRHLHQAPEAPGQPRLQIATPPHASQVPPQADSLLMLLQRYPIMWQGLLALKNDQSAVQMHFVFGNPHVARDSLPCNSDGSTPPLRIAQRMRLEQTQLEGVARKMQMDNEHCMLLALPCGRDHMDVLQQSTNLQTGFITYLQQKQAAGIVNIAHPGSQQAAYVVHIFPSCEFANENLARNAPDLLHRMQEIPHLVIVIATV